MKNASVQLAIPLALLACVAAMTAGCGQPAADTVLEIDLGGLGDVTAESKPIAIGLRDVQWRGAENDYESIGHGEYDWEHKGRIEWPFVQYAPVPSVDRYIYITPDAPANEWPDYRIALAVRPELLGVEMPTGTSDESPSAGMLLFSGTLSPPHEILFNKLEFQLRDVPMGAISGPIRTIYVSGKIIARRTTDAEFDDLLGSYEQSLGGDN